MTPFLLIPGLNCDARVYNGVAQTLWPFGPVTIANNREGEGVSAIAEGILATAPPRFGLVGFSMGGYIAFEILRQAPERVEKLALLDTTARPDSAESIENRKRRIALAEGGKFGLVIEQSYPATVHPDNASNSSLYSMHRAMADANGPEAYIRQQRAIIDRPDSRPVLSSIKVPTLIVVGEADEITPPDAAQEMHDAIPGSELVIVAQAGHLALLEHPLIVQNAIRAWAER